MRVTQGTFSYLPDLSDEEILAQIGYAIGQGWAVAVEHTTDPHPRNVYWDMWALPLFDLADPMPALHHVVSCRAAHPSGYVRVTAYDASLGRQTTAFSFIVQRPAAEPSFTLDRTDAGRFTLRSTTG
jgi:ribulose-bisphosphate carboxylase small chain